MRFLDDMLGYDPPSAEEVVAALEAAGLRVVDDATAHADYEERYALNDENDSPDPFFHADYTGTRYRVGACAIGEPRGCDVCTGRT